MALFGIDFGTASLRIVALPSNGRPTPADVVVAPAIASFARGSITVGEPVLMMAGAVDDPVVTGLKRLLGRDASDAWMRRACERAGLDALPHGAGDVELRRHDRSEAGLSVVRACAELLRYGCDLAVRGKSEHEAVIAVPSWFGKAQRDALLHAAAHAHIRVLRFIRDTVASSLWAAHAHGVRGNVAVVDVGAGGVNASVLVASDSALSLVATHGSAEIGGDDIDHELATAALERASRQAYELLRQASVAMKHALSSAERAERRVALPDGSEVPLTVERWELELLLGGMAKQIAALSAQVLDEAKLRPSDLEGVLVTGGMAASRALAGRVEASLGTRTSAIPLSDGPALGAALLAGVLSKRREGPALDDGERTPESYDAPPREPIGAADTPKRRHKSWVSAAQITTKRKPVDRHRPEVARRRVDPRRSERSSAAPPAAPAAVSFETRSDAPSASTERAPRLTPPPSASDPPAGHDAPDEVAIDSDPPGITYPGVDVAAPPPDSEPSPIGIESAKPARKPSFGGTKYPARDGQRKYPARDRPPRPDATPPRGGSALDGVPRRETKVGIARDVEAYQVGISSTPAPSNSVWPDDTMPSGRRTTLPAPQMPTEGTLTMAKSAGQVLALGITRQLLAEDLEPIATPVLLRRLLGRRSVSGTLRIRSSQLDIDVDIEAGNAMMTRGEHTAFMHVFEIEKGRWELVAERSQASQRELYPLPRLALEGVRRLLRLIPHQEMSEALGERNALAPKLVAEHATLPRRLGLSGRERRFVTEYVDGRASARALSRSVIVGASTCYQILALLELFGALAWLEPSSANPGTPVSPAGEPDGPPDSTP